MNPARVARVIAKHFDANAEELAWIERCIRTVLPRGHSDEASTPVRTVPGFPPPPEEPK